MEKVKGKVSFMICGTQKGGTTALSNYLQEHPQVHIPDRKEIHFFDNDKRNWDKPPYWLYHRTQHKSKPGQLWGDATPITMWWNPAPKRIYNYNPNMKMIVCLRNPISRAYSHWNMEYTRGKENLTFDEALIEEHDRSKKALPDQDRRYSYIDRGYYGHQLRRLWRYFGNDNVLVIRQEDLLKKPRNTLDRVCSHLEINKLDKFESKLSRVGTKNRPMSRWAHRYLQGCFEGEIKYLENTLGWQLKSWLKK